MAKKQTEEEKIISEAADTIMRTIRTAANRIADKYERKLMSEVVTRIQEQAKVQDAVSDFSGKLINDRLNKLSKE